MKKIFLLLATSLFAFTFPAQAETAWKVAAVPPPFAHIYEISPEQGIICKVSDYIFKPGLEFYARDGNHKNGPALSQGRIIGHCLSKDGPAAGKEHCNGDDRLSTETNQVYPVFKEQCVAKVKLLPSHVQALFFGMFDVR